MEYRYTDIKALIERFCSSHKSNLYLFESDDLCGQAILVFERCDMIVSLGELDWGPYYMTSIEIRTHNENVPASHKSEDLVFFFYDSRENTFKDIEDALNEAYQYGSTYDDSMLVLRINDECMLTENWRLGIHPDDEGYTGRADIKVYKCVGTFAQYYTLYDGVAEFRVLDKYIRWNSQNNKSVETGMNTKISIVRFYDDKDERLEFLLKNFDYIDGNELIAKIMSKEFGFVPAGQLDGIWYKITRIKKDDLVYELLWHEDLGNSIYSLTQNDYENDLLASRMNIVVGILNAGF